MTPPARIPEVQRYEGPPSPVVVPPGFTGAQRRVVHLYGRSEDRALLRVELAPLLAAAHAVVEHWGILPRVVVEQQHEALAPVPITRAQRWGNLAVIAAAMFVLGVVVYNVAVHP